MFASLPLHLTIYARIKSIPLIQSDNCLVVLGKSKVFSKLITLDQSLVENIEGCDKYYIFEGYPYNCLHCKDPPP